MVGPSHDCTAKDQTCFTVSSPITTDGTLMRPSLESNCGFAAVGRPILLGARLVEFGHLQGAVRSKDLHSVGCPRWAWRGSQKNNCKLHREFHHTRSNMCFFERWGNIYLKGLWVLIEDFLKLTFNCAFVLQDGLCLFKACV